MEKNKWPLFVHTTHTTLGNKLGVSTWTHINFEIQYCLVVVTKCLAKLECTLVSTLSNGFTFSGCLNTELRLISCSKEGGRSGTRE